MQSVQAKELGHRAYRQATNYQQEKSLAKVTSMQTFGFILEQGLGHRTHALNLQSTVSKDRAVHAIWQMMEQHQQGLSTRLPLYNRYWTLQAGLRARYHIAKIQRQTPLDALFFHTQVMAVLATNWVKRIPSVISLDATPLQYDELGEFYAHERGPSWLEDQKWRMNRSCFYHARHLVTWSKWAKEGLVDAYEVPAEKVTVVPPGINFCEWQRPTERQAHDGPVKVLFIGGNLKRKGGDDLLCAFQKLRQELRENRVNSAEHGLVDEPLELHLVTRDTLPEQPGVHLYQEMEPNSPALKALVHDCDIFCLPTYGDCLPIALVEASAAGLPCITTDVGGTAEIVLDGETGFLIQVGDSAALVDRLRSLITNVDLRLRLGAQAANMVQRRFNAERNTVQLLDLLKRAATGSV